MLNLDGGRQQQGQRWGSRFEPSHAESPAAGTGTHAMAHRSGGSRSGYLSTGRRQAFKTLRSRLSRVEMADSDPMPAGACWRRVKPRSRLTQLWLHRHSSGIKPRPNESQNASCALDSDTAGRRALVMHALVEISASACLPFPALAAASLPVLVIHCIQ